MFSIKLLFYSIIFLVLGLWLFFYGLKSIKKKRLIENIPTSKIRSLAMGLVEVFGSVMPAEKKILKSPFTNKDCVYYKYTVEEYKSSGKHSSWVMRKKDDERVPFYIKDDTGMVLVDPKGAKMDIPIDNEFYSRWGTDPPEQVKKFLKSQNLKYEGMLLGINRKMRYREYFVEPKDDLYIIGTAKDNPFTEEGTAKKGMEDVMIGKGKNERIFFISDKQEKTLLTALKLKSAGGLIGGGLLFIGSLTLILFNLNLM